MSVEAMTWAFSQPIPPAPKVVLLALANNADKKSGYAWPGIESIVENCAPMGKRMVQRHIRWLAAHNLLSTQARFKDSGRQTSNLYRLHLDTTYSGEGVTNDTLGEEVKTGGEDVLNEWGRVSQTTPSRVSQLCQWEGVIAMTPSDKNLDPLVEPQEGIPDGSRRDRRRVAVSTPAWEGYRRGHHKRYGVDPVRDATTNSILYSLVKKFGQDDAAKVAEFYCSLDRKVYVENKHPPGLLQRDCYGIHTELKQQASRAPSPESKTIPTTPNREIQGVPCPPEVEEHLANLFGRSRFSFPADKEKATA